MRRKGGGRGREGGGAVVCVANKYR